MQIATLDAPKLSLHDYLAGRAYVLPTAEESLATPLSDNLIFNWTMYAEKNPPTVNIENLAWDLRQRCGAERGLDMYRPLVEQWGDAETIDVQWAAADRPECEGDQHIIYELASIHSDDELLDLMLPDDGEALRNELKALGKRFDDLNWEAVDGDARLARYDARRAATSLMPGMSMPPHLQAVPAAPLPPLLVSSAEFIGGFVSPEYLIDGMLQRRYFYSTTAQTGVGKTAIAMRWMAHVVSGKSIGDREVQQGEVLYFAGENPDDVRARWLVLSREMGIDPNTDKITWIVGAKDLGAIATQIAAEVAARGIKPAFVVVDTAAAYFPGDEENGNVQMGAYARQLRSLTNLPGGPCVVALCHPTKNATPENMTPRGGGAFLCEVDGNMAVVRRESGILAVGPLGKFRGDMSWSQSYEIVVVKDHPKLKDARGRQMNSVIARPAADGAAALMEKRSDADLTILLRTVCDKPAATPSDLARHLGWTYGAKAEPHVNRVTRNLARLAKDGLVKEAIGKWRPTPAGQRELNAIDLQRLESAVSPPAFPRP